jgi:hypothetical protein
MAKCPTAVFIPQRRVLGAIVGIEHHQCVAATKHFTVAFRNIPGIGRFARLAATIATSTGVGC